MFCQEKVKSIVLTDHFVCLERHQARNNDKVCYAVKNESMMFPEIGCLKVQESGRPHGRIKIKIPN